MYILGNADKNMLVTKSENNKYYDENIKIDINDTNNTHSIIANKVKNGDICLDIGCGAGYIGEILKENRKCIIYGIDIDKDAIKVALNKKIYTEIYNFSIMDYSNKKFQNFLKKTPGFDYIFLADVLEHVINPGEVLFNFSQKLNKNGKFLVSVPNIAHFDIIKGLINKTFNYNKIGILDNTHLRFFTKQSFIDMIDGINEVYGTSFSAKLIGKTISEPDYLNKYPTLLKILNDEQESCVLQYVYEIEQSSSKTVKNRNYENKDYFSIVEEQLNQKEDLLIQLENEKNEISKIKDEKEKILKELENERFKNAKFNDEINNLSKSLEEQKCEFQNILNSKSWKITKPLRKLSSCIKSKKEKK